MRSAVKLFSRVAVFASIVLISQTCFSDSVSPLQFGIWPPVQLVDKTCDIYGIRMGLPMADNNESYGLDFGLFSRSKYFCGGQFSLLNTSTTAYGFQAGFVNRAGEKLGGFQAGVVNIAQEFGDTGDSIGFQAGLFNISSGFFGGLQVGAGNISSNSFSGIQIGAVNSFNNKGKESDSFCLQIGAFNFNSEGFLPFFPIVNLSF